MKTIEDSFLYLWHAHNRVNRRLHATSPATEDPQFIKQNFPPNYVCEKCHDEKKDSGFNEAAVKEFFIRYFRNIKPWNG